MTAFYQEWFKFTNYVDNLIDNLTNNLYTRFNVLFTQEADLDISLHAKKEERLVVPITEVQKEQLHSYADELGVSMAMAARLILSQFFDSNSQKKLVPNKERKAG